MRNYRILLGALLPLAFAACQPAGGKYVDLNTGETIQVDTNKQTGELVNAKTGDPVTLYVNTSTHDTIYAPTGAVVNNKLVKADDGTYAYPEAVEVSHNTMQQANAAEEQKVKGEDYKKKVDEDGDIKIKQGDTKIKIDGETGERKVKKD